jgi:hypothetical protein
MEGSGLATSSGSFVMYNCARLATLFKHFEEEVDCGELKNLFILMNENCLLTYHTEFLKLTFPYFSLDKTSSFIIYLYELTE